MVDFNTNIPTDTNIGALKSLGRHNWNTPGSTSDFSVQLNPDADRLTVKDFAFDTVVSRTTLSFTRPENLAETRLTSLLVDAVLDQKVPHAYDKISNPYSTAEIAELQPESVHGDDFSRRVEWLRGCIEPMGFGADTVAYFKCSINAFRTMKLKTANCQSALAAAFYLWGRAAGFASRAAPTRFTRLHGSLAILATYSVLITRPCSLYNGLRFHGPRTKCCRGRRHHCMFDGSRLPFVLRSAREEWTFHGLAYTHGITYDALKDLGRSQSLVEQEFVLR